MRVHGLHIGTSFRSPSHPVHLNMLLILDIQRAAEVIFDSHPSAPLSVLPPRNYPPPASPVDTFKLDDSTQGLLGDPENSRQFKRVVSTILYNHYLHTP